MIAIPDKLYFKIGEVCKLANVKPHVVRYWESEFPVIRPKRASSKQRLYRRVDVENILKIHDLLYQQGFTIAGAKKALTSESNKKKEVAKEVKKEPRKAAPKGIDTKLFKDIKSELLELKSILEK